MPGATITRIGGPQRDGLYELTRNDLGSSISAILADAEASILAKDGALLASPAALF